MKVRNTVELPKEYDEALRIDLQHNKKELLLVNGAALLIGIVMAVVGFFIVHPIHMFDFSSPLPTLLRLGVLLLGMVLYLVLHELVHGLFFLMFGCGAKPTFGFTGMYAFAASRTYYTRTDYLIIGLSPIVFWGIVLLVLNFIVPTPWFWVVYFIQIVNVSGAAGDLYVAYRLLRMPKSLLVQDDGTAMRVYLPKRHKKRK